MAEGPGPDLKLVASYPTDGDGLDCDADDPSCGVPIDTVLQLRFDRFLRPSTAIRQSIRITSGATTRFLSPDYDLVERVLIYRPSAPLEPGALYTLELLSPTEDNAFGFRAFDGAPLSAAGAPIKIQFRTTRDETQSAPLAEEPAPDCQTINTIFNTCAASGCHKSTEDDVPRMGLALDPRRPEKWLETAIDKPAHQTEVGATTGLTLTDPERFGVAMPIIDPGRPSSSYLMYKLLRLSENYKDNQDSFASDRYQLPQVDDVQPSDEEQARLREWFVRGNPMPDGGFSLGREQLRALQRWIQVGAPLNGCK